MTVDEKKRRITKEKLDVCLLEAEKQKLEKLQEERTTLVDFQTLIPC